MLLITKEILKKTPALYATEEIPLKEKVVTAKFFTPWSNWTWYMVEFNPETNTAWGLVDGLEKEWGYFSIDELKSVRGPFGLNIERDIHFDPTPVSEVL